MHEATKMVDSALCGKLYTRRQLGSLTEALALLRERRMDLREASIPLFG
jgi:hypothetical protein